MKQLQDWNEPKVHALLNEPLRKVAAALAPEKVAEIFREAALSGNTKLIESLLDQGVPVNIQDPKYGETALKVATMMGHTSAVKLLITRGANLHCTDFSGFQPIHVAATGGYRDTELIAFIVNLGANINARAKDGSTPLMLAARDCRPKVIRFLREKGVDIGARDAYGKTAMDYLGNYSPSECGLSKEALKRHEAKLLGPMDLINPDRPNIG